MDLVTEAVIFASKAHDGMRRKLSSAPYIMHPLEAAVTVSSITSDQEIIAASVLHDVVEDANIQPEEIEELKEAAKELNFEMAAQVRDALIELKRGV